MFGNPYLKSLLWLVSFGGIGYGLMLLTEPNAEKIERIKASSRGHPNQTDDEKRKALFMKRLQEAANTSTPLYRTPTGDKKD
ncbi:uncharacterized protein LOC111075410 [Drosophila obscura]|uniref:uncharacterized protein LOC111075410 n=1 Tax=Drosophila obscura TaxID=7282 RepID=UPI000BA08302|nr:uncharacterized protein LOC111075410 [Drosophila obscura]